MEITYSYMIHLQKIDEALNAFDAYRYDATNNMSGNNNNDNMTNDTNGNTDSSMSNR